MGHTASRYSTGSLSGEKQHSELPPGHGFKNPVFDLGKRGRTLVRRGRSLANIIDTAQLQPYSERLVKVSNN